MKKSKFSGHQIVNILKEYVSGKSIRDICSEHGITVSTFYQWKQKYGGMDTQHLKELKYLQEENSQLKRMFADLILDHRILKDIIENRLKGAHEFH